MKTLTSCLGAALACLAVSIGGGAAAQTFTAPLRFGLNGHASSLGLGIDAKGNALAAWADAGMYYSTRPAGGAWSAPQSFLLGGAFPQLKATSAGAATIVSYDSGYGIWSVDLTPSGWSAPALAVNAPDLVTVPRISAPPVIFVANDAGAQAVAFANYAAGLYTISAARRPVGGTWGNVETIATGTSTSFVGLSSAAIGAQGDVLVAYETFTVACSVRYCNDTNFVLHVARETAPGSGWSDSGPLTPAANAYETETVIDASGHAGVFVTGEYGPLVQVATQTAAGAPWRALATVFGATGVNFPIFGAAKASTKGQASLAFVNDVSPLPAVTVLDGNLTTDVWPTATNLSASDAFQPYPVIAFGANSVGGTAVSWADYDGSVHVATRRTARATWAAPQTIASGAPCYVLNLTCTVPGAAAINAAGHSVVGYFRTDPTGLTTALYLSTD